MCVRHLDVRPQERPGTVRPLVRSVEANVTTPDDVGTQLNERGDEARRLRVVDDHDVSSPNLTADGLAVPGKRALVDGALPLPEFLRRRASRRDRCGFAS